MSFQTMKIPNSLCPLLFTFSDIHNSVYTTVASWAGGYRQVMKMDLA